MQIQLRKRPALPQRGKNPATFGEFRLETSPDATGEPRKELVIPVVLDAKQADGSPHKLEESYNLLGRGVNKLQKDYAMWSGRGLTDEELDSFDPDTLLKGKRVIVEVKHRKVGTKLVAYIASFHPAEVVAQPIA